MLYRTVRTTEGGAAQRLSLSSCTYTHARCMYAAKSFIYFRRQERGSKGTLAYKSVPALYTQVTPGLAKAGIERFFSMVPVDNLVHHIRETRALLLSRENNISSWIDFLPARTTSFSASDVSPSIRKAKVHHDDGNYI